MHVGNLNRRRQFFYYFTFTEAVSLVMETVTGWKGWCKPFSHVSQPEM
jgi:hypothetical protein